MKFAAIAPIDFLQQTSGQPVHMALAHLTKSPVYCGFFSNEAENGSLVIMDNSIVEIGYPLPAHELVKAANLCGAHEIIIPDGFRDSKETIRLAKENIPILRDTWKGRLMGVAHGKDLTDWYKCAKELLALGVDTLGVPKVMTSILGPKGRLDCLEAIKSELEKYPNVEVHLLGIWDNPLEIGMIHNAVINGAVPEVRSVDSVIAFKYAQFQKRFDEGERPNGPVDFMKEPFNPIVGNIHAQNIMECWRFAGGNMRYLPDSSYQVTSSDIYFPPVHDGNVTYLEFRQEV